MISDQSTALAKHCSIALLLFCALSLSASISPLYAAPTQPISEIRDLIDQAVASHASQVVIPAGVYRGGPPPGNSVILTLKNVDNLKVVANGVFMVCTMRTRALEMDNCSNIEFDGLAIDYDPLTFTQGKITGIAPDKSWIDITLDAGYPRTAFSRIDIVDPHTRFRIRGMPFLWGTTATLVSPDVVRVTLNNIGSAAPLGSLASLSGGNEDGGVCHCVDLEDCRGGMVLRNMTIYCAPGMGIVEHGGDGGTKLLGVQIIPGPLPQGATEPRLLTTSWDGIMHSSIRRGPDVENCKIVDCGDDSWSDQSGPSLVVKSDGNQIVLAGGADLSSGDHLQQSLSAKPLTLVSCGHVPVAAAGLDAATIQKLDNAPQWTLWAVNHDTVQIITVSGSLATPDVGASLYSPDHQGCGFIFNHNYVYSSGRLLIKASHGLIAGNTLIDGHNTVIDPEVPAGAAFGINDIVFRNNTIIGADTSCNTPWSAQAGAFSAVASAANNTFASAGSFANIAVEDNTFENIDGACVALAGVEGAIVIGNQFIRPHTASLSTSGASYGIDQASVVFVRDCDHVQVAHNQLTSPGAYEQHILDADASVTNLTGANQGIALAGSNLKSQE